MSDESTPPASTRRAQTSGGVSASAEDRAAVKRKIVRKLSKLASSLLASGAIEPPAQASLEAEPPRRAHRGTRRK